MMGITSSIISVGDLENSRDISSEYYRPEYLRLAKLLRARPNANLRAVACLTDGEHGSPDWDPHSGIRYIAAEHVLPNRISNAPMRTISEAQDARNARCRVQKNDILVYSVGAYAGFAAKAEPHLFPASIPRSVAIIRLKPEAPFNAGFVSVFLNTEFGRFQTQRLRAGNSQPVLALEKIRQIELPHIPLELQDHIGQLYDGAYEARLNADRSYATAQQLLESELGLDKLTFNKSVGYTARLSALEMARRSDAEFYLPKYQAIIEGILDKPHMTLGARFTISRGVCIDPRIYSEIEGVPYIRIKELSLNRSLTPEESIRIPLRFISANYPKAAFGDYVLAVIGATIGKVNLIEEAMTGSLYSNNTARLSPKTVIGYPNAMELILRSPIVQQQIQQRMAKTAQEKITDPELKKILIPDLDPGLLDTLENLCVNAKQSALKSKGLLSQGKARVEQLIQEAVKS